jgi:hypothetical protein
VTLIGTTTVVTGAGDAAVGVPPAVKGQTYAVPMWPAATSAA